jgi:hypothetical protein
MIESAQVQLPRSPEPRKQNLGQSLNRLFQDGLLLLDQREREWQLFDDFSAIAATRPGESDVEFALAAQNRATAGP